MLDFSLCLSSIWRNWQVNSAETENQKQFQKTVPIILLLYVMWMVFELVVFRHYVVT